MTSAGIFIVATRRPVLWTTLRWACGGAAIATPIGIAFIAPVINDTVVKLLFAVLWASFGIMHFVKVREFIRFTDILPETRRFERLMGLSVGMLGGATVAATTGVGVDMLVYTVLVLVCRCDLRVAIPTSVILMAFTSLVGVATTFALHELDPAQYPIRDGAFGNWIAAAPIVAVGAPLGALMVGLIPRQYTLVFLSVLCILQFVWTGLHEGIGPTGWTLAVLAVLVCNAVYHVLYRWGRRRARRTGAA
jgi:uncharacterized membrane protein YfcA